MSNALQTTKCTDTTKAESKKTHTETTEDKLEKKQQQKKKSKRKHRVIHTLRWTKQTDEVPYVGSSA